MNYLFSTLLWAFAASNERIFFCKIQVSKCIKIFKLKFCNSSNEFLLQLLSAIHIEYEILTLVFIKVGMW